MVIYPRFMEALSARLTTVGRLAVQEFHQGRKDTGEGAGATRAWSSRREPCGTAASAVFVGTRSPFPEPLVIFGPCNQALSNRIFPNISNLVFEAFCMTDDMVE